MRFVELLCQPQTMVDNKWCTLCYVYKKVIIQFTQISDYTISLLFY